MQNRSFFRVQHTVLAAVMFVLVSILHGCSPGPGEPGDSKTTMTTTVWGTVVDESGNPVQGATVTNGTISTTSDAQGIFVLRNISTPSDRCFVLAKKTGFFTAARADVPVKNGAVRMKLSMMSSQSTITINSAAGGVVPASGASVAFQPGSFKKKDGTPYSGTVKVAARYLNPDNMNFSDYFSGDYTALTSDNKEVQLISCGVLRVELRGSAGEELLLDENKPATLTYPVPNSQKTAPSSMPLWYFDETLGMWKEDGSAVLQSGTYVGTVTHFTDWNLDYMQGENGTVQMRIVCDDMPIPGVAVMIGGFFNKTGYSDQNGIVRFVRVPADKEIEIYIRSEDNAGLYFINTPVKAQLIPKGDLNIGDIVLNSPCPAVISGNIVGCDGSNIDALVLIKWSFGSSLLYTVDGTFTMMVPPSEPLTVYTTDPGGNEVSNDILALGSGEKRNIGMIKNCGSGTPSYQDIDITMTGGAIALSHDGAYLVTANSTTNTLSVYDAVTSVLIADIVNTGGKIPSNAMIDMSSDNSKIVVSSKTEIGAVLFGFDGSQLTKLLTINGTYGCQILDDGSSLIAESSSNHNITLYSAADGSILKKLSYTLKTGIDSANFAVNESERAVVCINGNSIDVWSIDNDALIRSIPTNSPFTTLSSNNDGSLIVSSVQYYKYSFYNCITGVHIGDKINSSRDSGINIINNRVILGTSMIAVYGAVQNALSVQLLALGTWDVLSVKLIPGTAKLNEMSNSVALSRNEKRLAACFNNKIRIWALQ